MEGVKFYSPNGAVFADPPIIPCFRNEASPDPTIVLISGACTALTWIYGESKSIAARLHALGHDVVVLELPGFRGRPADLKRFSWQSAMNTLKGQLEPIRRTRTIRLVGDSLGAFAAISLAADTSVPGAEPGFHSKDSPLVLFNPPFKYNDVFCKALHYLREKLGVFRRPSNGSHRISKLVLRILLSIRYPLGVPAGSDYIDRRPLIEQLRHELEINGPLCYEYWPTAALAEYLSIIPMIRSQLRSICAPVHMVVSELDQLLVPCMGLDELLRPESREASHLTAIYGGHLASLCYPQVAVQLILS